jgi:hypothetical protein
VEEAAEAVVVLNNPLKEQEAMEDVEAQEQVAVVAILMKAPTTWLGG